MQTNISAKHLQLTPAIEDYIHKKSDRIRKHFDRVQGIYVVLQKEPQGYRVEVKTDVEKHDDFVANANDEDLYACTFPATSTPSMLPPLRVRRCANARIG